jgi:tetratricopeptide (TPR) repeat protein
VDRAGSRGARLASIGLVASLGTGCVTFAPRSRVPGPEATVLDHAPVRAFAEDQCGPGSLSVVLNTLGDAVSAEELAASLPRDRGGGVLSVDLLLAARQRGFSASLVSGDEGAVRGEIQAGRPVILLLRLLNVPGRHGDIYHYVVVDGHDPGHGLFRIQFGDGKARWASLEQLDGAWKGGGHAMLTVSVTPEFAQLRAAVELERVGRLDEAARLYTQLVEASPQLQQAWVNLGNVEAARGRPDEAERAYRRAVSISRDDPDALNNLAWLLLQEGARLEEAERLARDAAQRRGPDRALILDTLARIQSARGRCAEADATWAEALALPALSPRQRTQLEDARREAVRDCPAARQ